MDCPKCGAINPATATICRVCQSSLATSTQVLDEDGLTPEELALGAKIWKVIWVSLLVLGAFGGWRIAEAFFGPPDVEILNTRTATILGTRFPQYSPPDGHHYVIAHIRVTNNRFRPVIPIAFNTFVANTKSATSHPSNGFLGPAPDNVTLLPSVGLRPGGSATGEVVFAVPISSEIESIFYNPLR